MSRNLHQRQTDEKTSKTTKVVNKSKKGSILKRRPCIHKDLFFLQQSDKTKVYKFCVLREEQPKNELFVVSWEGKGLILETYKGDNKNLFEATDSAADDVTSV